MAGRTSYKIASCLKDLSSCRRDAPFVECWKNHCDSALDTVSNPEPTPKTMKTSRHNPFPRTLQTFLWLCSCLCFSFFANQAGAAIEWWDPNGTTSVGGNGTWDTTTARWSPNSTQVAAGSLIVWNTANAAGFCAGPSSSLQQGVFFVTNNTANLGFAGIFNGSQSPGPCDVTILGSGSLTLASGAQAFSTLSSSLGFTRIQVPINGSGQVTPESSGQLFLEAANTYTGGTLLGFSGSPFSGIVNFNNASSFGSGTITLQSLGSSGALVLEGASALTIANAVNVTGNTTNNIVGNTAGLTFSGPWTLNANTAQIGSGGGVNNLVTISGVISGTGSLGKLNQGSSGILKLTGVNTYSGPSTNLSGTFMIGGAGKLGSGTYAAAFNNNGTFNYNSTAAQTLSGIMSGTGSLIQNGSGTLTLSGVNTYSGTTTINGGILSIVADSGLGTAPGSATPGSVTLNGGTLQHTSSGVGSTFINGNRGIAIGASGGTIDIPNSVAVLVYTSGQITGSGNTLTKTGAGTFRNTTPTSITFTKLVVTGGLFQGAVDTIFGAVPGSFLADAITLNGGGVSANAGFSFSANRGITLGASGGTIDGASNPTVPQIVAGSGNLTKTGTSTLVLSGANTYTGKTIVNGGTLTINNAAGDTALGTPPGGIVADQLTLNAGTTFSLGSAANATLSANRGITLGGAATINLTSKDLTVPGIIAGASGSLTKSGANALILSGANTFAGGLTMAGGTLTLNNNTAAGSGTITITPAGTCLIAGKNGTTTLANPITINVGGGQTIDFIATSGNNLTLNGQITGTAAYSRGINGGAGNVTLNGNNSTYSGTVSLLQGPLVLGHKNALGTGGLVVTPGSVAISLAANTALTGVNAVANAVTLNGTLPVTTTSDLELSGILSGASGAVTKSGSGALILSGANSYSGATTVNAGTLVVNNTSGSGTGSGGVTVNNTGTLGGNGTISGPVTVALGGTFSPGSSIGTLTINNTLSLAGNARMEINRAAVPSSDLATGMSTVTYGGTLTVTNLGAALQAGDCFTLFASSAYAGGFTNLVLPSLDPGLAWVTSGLGVTGAICVSNLPVVSVTPASTNVECGTVVTFAANASGTGTLTYQWYNTASNAISGATSSTLTLAPVTGTYTVVVTDAIGSSSASATVTVTPDTTPPVITCATNKTVECGSNWSFDPPAAFDLCCGTNVTVSVLNTVTNGTQCAQTITRTWQAVDCSSLTNTCSQTVTVTDTTPPTITCATNKTVNLGDTWSFDDPTAVDACCGTNVTIIELNTVTNNATGTTCSEDITRTWQATDCCSNSVTCSQTVTVIDVPSITCATNKTVECGSNWSFDDPIVTDPGCPPPFTVTIVGTVTNGTACSQVITRTWEVMNCCNNAADCSQTVTVVDTTPPTINCGQNETVQCTTSWDFTVPIVDDACSGPGGVMLSILSTVTNAGCGGTYTATRVWQATDGCSNSTTCTQIVSVVDFDPPVITCASNKTVECGSTWSFDDPTAFDACCSQVTITILNTVTNSLCPQSITRTWQAADCCSNSATCSQTVTVAACVQAPAGFTLWLPFDETSGSTSANLYAPGNSGTQINSPSVTSGYVVNSLCFDGTSQYVTVPDYPGINPGTGDLSIDAWVKRSSSSGNVVRIIVDKRDPFSGIGYSLSVSFGNLVFQLADSSGFTNHRDTGTVAADDQWHFVAVTVNRALTNGGQFYVDGAATAAFDPTGNPGNLDNTNAFYVAASPLGGNAPWLGCIDEVEFFPRVLVAGEVAGIFNAGPAGKCKTPLLVCAGDKTVECGSNWSFDDPTVNYPCGCTNVTITVLNTVTNANADGTTGSPCSYSVTQTWQATDCCSNSATCSQTVTVTDTTPPVITCAPGKGVICGTPWTFDPPTAYDACCGSNVTITVVGTVTNGLGCDLLITRTWQATDCCGNSDTCSQTIQTGDTTPPVFTCASNKTVECGSEWTFDPPSAYDDCCGTNVTISMVSTVSSNVNQCTTLITQTWQATDCCGNSSTCSQTVTTVDTTPPVITCAGNKTVACGSAWSFDDPTAYDACCGSNVTITVLSTVTNGLCPQTITRTWQATDCCTNSATCSQTVTVVSCVAPPPDMTLWLPFDETSGTTSTNLYAGGNSGTQMNGPSSNSGYVANSLCFDGVDDYVEVADYAAINIGTGDFSVDAWIKPATLGSTIRVIVDHRAEINGTAVGYSLFLGGNNNIGFQIGDGAFINYPSTFSVPADGQWHHVAVTVKRSDTNGIHFFLDGVVGALGRDPTPYSGSITPPPNYPFRVGSRSSSVSGLFAGCIDEVEVFVRELATNEVQGLFLAGAAGKCKTPMLVCAPEKTVECGSDWSFDPPEVNYPCGCTNVAVIVLNTVTNGDPVVPCSQHITRTWQATDCCSNSSTCSQTVTVVDSTPPVITCAPGKGVICGTPWDFDPPSAYDACCGSNVTITVLNTVTNGRGCDLLITRTWQATDCCGNSDTCSQSIQTGDTTPPDITCAPGKGVICGTPWSFDPPSAFDACCGTNVTIIVLSTVTNGTDCNGLITRTWQATDCCGNSATCSQSVQTIDTTPPVFTGNCTNYHFEAGTTTDDFVGPEPSSPSPGLLLRENGATLKGFDDCTVNAAVVHTFTNLPPCITAATVTIRLKPCGDICCNDTIALFFTSPSGALVAGSGTWSRALGSGCTAQPGLFADNWCDHTNGEVIVLDLAALPLPSGMTNLLGDLNANGFLDFSLQDDTSIDYITLDVTSCCCAAPRTVQCGEEWTFDAVTAYDACCGTNVTISVLDTVTNGICPKVITRTIQATDCCGNSATCAQVVRVIDTTPPVFNSVCVTNHYEAGTTTDNFVGPEPASPSAGLLIREAGATLKGFDDCTVNAAVAHTFANLPQCITSATVTVRLKACGENCCNDSMALFFTGPNGALVAGSGTWSRPLGSGCTTQPGLFSDNWCSHTAGDVIVLDLAALPLPSGTTNLLADLNANGFLDFTLQDDSSIDYITLDVVSCCCANNKTVDCSSNWTFDPPTATDACCGTDVTIGVLDTVTNGVCPKLITRTWQATDCCGNSSTCSQTVTVVDTTPPVITCALGIGVICGTHWDFTEPTAYDACCGTNVTITVLSTVTNGNNCSGLITRTWQATDCCGNSATCSQSIQIIDTTPPVITCATNKSVPCGTPWSFDPPSAVDDCCGTNVTVSVISTVTNGMGCTQIITRTWQATDCCDNQATCDQTVTVVSPDCSPVIITAVSFSGTNFTMSFQSLSCVVYDCQYKDDLIGGPPWTTFQTVTGTGGVITVQNSPPAGTPHRFYRVVCRCH